MSFNMYPYTCFHEMNDDWVIARVKEMIAAWAQTQSAWIDMQTEFASLKAFVNTYFEELDVQEEINHKLDAMAADGSLASLLRPYIPDAVAAWLNDHVDPDTGYVIDDTLTISNAAADAETVGDHFKMSTVPDGSDLNNLRSPGFFNFLYTGTYTNLPVAVTTLPVMIVSSNLLETGTNVRQICIAGTTGKVYIRAYTSGTWSDWKSYDDTLDSKIDGINTILTNGTILSGDDLNNFKREGTYRFAATGTFANMPGFSGNRPILIVISSDLTSSPSNCRQILVDYATGITYTRYFVSGAWSEWFSSQYAPTSIDTAHHTIAHRGVPHYTPEGTKPSYALAKKMGLLIAEADVRFTIDSVPVVFHNASYTVDGVTHTIADETYDQFMTYDQGAAYSAAYTGTYGLSLSAFLTLCKDLQLHPVIEFKTGTTEQIESCLDMIDAMHVKVFNFKASVDNLKTIIDHDPYASVRLGADDYSAGLLANVTEIVNYGEKHHQTHCIYATYGSWTSEQIAACRSAGAIIGVSSINSMSQLQALTEDVDLIFTEYGFNATAAKTALACK